MGTWLNGVGIATTGDFYGPDSGATSDSTFSNSGAVASAPNTSASAGGSTTGSSLATADEAPAIQSKDLMPSLKGMNPLLWIPLILGFIVCVRILREWGSKQDEIKEARTGLYFGIMAALWSIAIIPLVKSIFAKYHVNGLSEYIQNA